MSLNTCHYTRKEVSQARKIGAIHLAKDIATDAAWDSGEWDTLEAAKLDAEMWIDRMHILTVYAYLKNGGFSFDVNNIRWVFHLQYSDEMPSDQEES